MKTESRPTNIDAREAMSQQRVIRPRWVDWPDALGWWYDAELDNWIKLKKRLTRDFFAPQPPRRWYGPWVACFDGEPNADITGGTPEVKL
jgi:hypothetical protein